MRILAGMYSDSETSLYYWGSRYYDPKTGRSITPDRMSVAEHVQRWQANQSRPNRPPLEINPYAYVANNPLRWIDRSGRVIETWEPSESITHDPIGWGLPPGPFGPVCGPAGTDLATWIPDAHFGSGFSGACEEHDECYDCSGRPRKDCDDNFCKTLLQSCAAQYGSGLGRQGSDRMARAYCRAVRENGQQYYKK
ncbi:MAG: RHS repeat-associated core domain-containing protein [Sulfuricaulis sp.]